MAFPKKPGIRIAPPAGIFLFFLTGFSWYLVVVYRHPDLLSYFLGKEVIGRISSDAVRNPEWYKPFIIYLPVLIFGAGPWLYFESRLLVEKRLFLPKNLWFYFRKGNEASFLLLWLLLPLLLFFLVKSRLPFYILPLYPAIALAVARWLSGNGQEIRILRMVSRTSLYTALVLIALKGVMSFYPHKNNMKSLYEVSRRVGGDGAEVFLFNRPELYGLQYYLKGRLQRVSVSGKEKWADRSLDNLTGEIHGTVSSKSRLLISDRQQAPNLSEVLKESDILFRRYDEGYWILYLIGKGIKPSEKPQWS